MKKLMHYAAVLLSALLPTPALAHDGRHEGDLFWSLAHFGALDEFLSMAVITVWASIFLCAAYWLLPGRSASHWRQSR